MGETIIYNPKCETMPREDLEQLQIERLQLLSTTAVLLQGRFSIQVLP